MRTSAWVWMMTLAAVSAACDKRTQTSTSQTSTNADDKPREQQPPTKADEPREQHPTTIVAQRTPLPDGVTLSQAQSLDNDATKTASEVEAILAKANPVRWAPAGSGNMYAAGVEPNGSVTYPCRAKVANEYWLGRTWPGAGCFIGIDGRSEYAAPNNFDVLVGDGGQWVTTHHGGVVPNAAMEGKLVLCVAIRATGETVPGWLAPGGKDGDCYYQWEGHDGHESHYRLLVIGEQDTLAKNGTDIPAKCSGGPCELLDNLGTWIAAHPARAAAIVGGAIVAAYVCTQLGGAVGGAIGGPPGAAGGAILCSIAL